MVVRHPPGSQAFRRTTTRVIATTRTRARALVAFSAAFASGSPSAFVRSAVVTAAMAPGVNTYVFASMYGRGQAQAASTIVLATGLSVLTASLWLALLGGVG